MQNSKMRNFIEKIIKEEIENFNKKGINISKEDLEQMKIIQYLDMKTGAVDGNSKSRRNFANIYAIYSILHFYQEQFFNQRKKYENFEGYEYTQLFGYYRSLYGGSKLQNHALNTRVNGEFKNIFKEDDLIIANNGKYLLFVKYLYFNDIDVSKVVIRIIEEYVNLLRKKDFSLATILENLMESTDYEMKKNKLLELLTEDSEARIFEIISYAVLKNHYKSTKIYIGYSLENLKEEYLTLYKTGRTNANDGGIDFVMRPIGRFYQVTEVDNYDKYLLDIDKVMHFPVTFIIKTNKEKSIIENELQIYIENKSQGMKVLKERYKNAIEEIITINELKIWLEDLKDEEVDSLIRDIDLCYKLEFNLEI